MSLFGSIKKLSNPNRKTLTYGSEALQFGKLYVPDRPGPHPTVILIHGGFWYASYGLSLMKKLAKDLAQQGIAAWNIEYRRIGDRGGGWPGTLLDVAQAADYLRTLAPMYELDLQRVVALGHSAGGHLALWLAARSRIASGSPLAPNSDLPLPLVGAISLAGAVDLEHVWRLKLGNGAAAQLLDGGPKDVPERYATASPAALLPLGVRQVLIHGTEDTCVPLIVSQSYVSKARKVGDDATLIELPGAGHFVVIDPTSEAWAITMKELEKMFHMLSS